MGKTGKWIKNLLLVGKKDKDKGGGGTSYETLKSSTTTKEKRRWNFRRSSKDFSNNSMDFSIIQTTPMDAENGHKKHSLTVAAAAADAAMAAEHAAAAVIHLTAVAETTRQAALEEAAAIKIQAVFRSHLARKALRALKGLVKLQAIVKGHLVRKQAATTLRCMQALVTVQARARAHRILMAAEESYPPAQRLSIHRKSSKENRLRLKHIMDRGFEESIKVVEMDLGEKRVGSKRRNSYSAQSHFETTEQDYVYQMSPAASTLTEMSPRGCIGYLEVDNMSHNGQIHPNYMANTESSKAKTRSQSAPKQRSGLFERQSSRRKASNNVPRAVRMQRSSSHVGSTGNGYQFPWSTKLDQSTVSLKDSECGSSSTIISRTNYCKSVVEYELGNY